MWNEPPRVAEIRIEPGLEDKVCETCTYWQPHGDGRGYCRIDGNEARWPVTDRMDGCEEHIRRMRL